MSPYQEQVAEFAGLCIAYHEDHGVICAGSSVEEVQELLRCLQSLSQDFDINDVYVQYVVD